MHSALALAATAGSVFAAAGQGRRQAAAGPDRQDRLDRPALGPDGRRSATTSSTAGSSSIEKFNGSNPAGVKFEIIGIDNKLSPTESLNALKSAIDQGIRYIIQGNGSSVALALIDAINKYNERNPGKEVIFLNYAAVDPDLTNSKCSFWHFRFDADTTMKMEAMTTFMKDQKDIKKVYLFNQNYSHGQQVAQVRQGIPQAQAPRHRDRRRRPASAGPGPRLRALHRQDQGLGRRHGDHRQLGLRPVAAGQGGARGRLQRQVLHLLRRRHRHADRARHQRRRQGVPDRLRPLQHGRPDGQGHGRSSRHKYNDDFYTGSIIRIPRR